MCVNEGATLYLLLPKPYEPQLSQDTRTLTGTESIIHPAWLHRADALSKGVHSCYSHITILRWYIPQSTSRKFFSKALREVALRSLTSTSPACLLPRSSLLAQLDGHHVTGFFAESTTSLVCR